MSDRRKNCRSVTERLIREIEEDTYIRTENDPKKKKEQKTLI